MLVTKSSGLLPSLCVPCVNVDFPFFFLGEEIFLSLGSVWVTVLSPALLHRPCLSPGHSFEIAVPQICVPGSLSSCDRTPVCIPLSDGLNFNLYTHGTTSGSLGPTPHLSLTSLFHVAYRTLETHCVPSQTYCFPSS